MPNNVNQKLKVHYVPIKNLNPAPYNPRHWSEEAISHLKESISRFGLIDPIIVNCAPRRRNIVIGGHFRLKIAKDLGYKEVPVVHVNIPSLKKEKELNLRLNRNTGSWDFKLLKDFDVDILKDIGFDEEDLSNIFDDNLEVQADGFDEEKEIEKAKDTDIKLGDYFALGRHRLLCGDATDHKTVKKLMGNVRADMINDDIPYNIGLSYDKGVGGKGKYGGNMNDNKTDTEYRKFVKSIIQNSLAVTKKDAHIMFWSDERYVWLLQTLYQELGIDSKRLCIWCKNNSSPTPQIAFNKMTEYVVYGTIGKPYLNNKVRNLNEILNKEIGTGNQLHDDIMDLFNIWLVKRLPGQSYSHPTEKPVTLHENALRRCTKPGDLVLDLFGGSGSLLSACEQLKRTAYLCEIEPIFCQVIISRFKKVSKEKVRKLN